jgi:hypothetical protein
MHDINTSFYKLWVILQFTIQKIFKRPTWSCVMKNSTNPLFNNIFIAIIISLLLYFLIPNGSSWGAPGFQTVPTFGPSPTQNQPPAPTSNPTNSSSQPTSRPISTEVPTLEQFLPTFTLSGVTLTNSPLATTVVPPILDKSNTPSKTSSNQNPLVPSSTSVNVSGTQQFPVEIVPTSQINITPTTNSNTGSNNRPRLGFSLIFLGMAIVAGATFWYLRSSKKDKL